MGFLEGNVDDTEGGDDDGFGEAAEPEPEKVVVKKKKMKKNEDGEMETDDEEEEEEDEKEEEEKEEEEGKEGEEGAEETVVPESETSGDDKDIENIDMKSETSEESGVRDLDENREVDHGEEGLLEFEDEAWWDQDGGLDDSDIHDWNVVNANKEVVDGYLVSMKLRKLAHGKSKVVQGLQFAPDQQTIATACADSELRLVNISTGQLNGRHTHYGKVNDVVFHPSGSYLASCGADGRLMFVDQFGEVLRTLQVFKGPKKTETLTATGEVVRNDTKGAPKEKPVELLSLAWSPSGDTVVVGCADNHIRKVKPETAELISEHKYDGKIEPVVFSPSGKMLAFGAVRKYKLRVVNPDDMKMIKEQKNDGTVRCIAWTPNEEEIAFGTADVYKTEGVRVLSVATWEKNLVVGTDATVRALAYSPDGQYFIHSCYEMYKIWMRSALDGSPLRLFDKFGTWVRTLQFSPKGDWIACGNKATLWLIKSKENASSLSVVGYKPTNNIRFLGHKMAVESVDWSCDGQYIATGCEDKKSRIIALATGQSQVTQHGGAVKCVSFHPDGDLLVTGCADGKVRYISITGSIIGMLECGKKSPVASLACSPAGKICAAGCKDKKIRILDTATCQLVKEAAFDATIISLVFTPDGNKLAFGAEGKNNLRVVDPNTLAVLQTVNTAAAVCTMSFSPDGKMIGFATLSKPHPKLKIIAEPFRIAEVTDGKIADKAIQEDKKVTSVAAVRALAFSHDSKCFVHGVENQNVLWLRVPELYKERRKYGSLDSEQMKSWPRAIKYSPTGEWIASTNKEGLWLFRNSAVIADPPYSTLLPGKPRKGAKVEAIAGSNIVEEAPEKLRAAAGADSTDGSSIQNQEVPPALPSAVEA